MESNSQCATGKEFYKVDNFLTIKLQILMTYIVVTSQCRLCCNLYIFEQERTIMNIMIIGDVF